jgi:hypothetical protein
MANNTQTKPHGNDANKEKYPRKATSKSRINRHASKPKNDVDIPGRPVLPEASTAGLNDASWYAANPQLMSDSASINYFNSLGTNINLITSDVAENWVESVPGVAALQFIPGCGYSDGPTSAVNIAAKNIYSWIRHANSGHANYESPNLMMYILAMDSAYSFVAFLRRLYGELMMYSQFNRYMPSALIESDGVNFADLQKHIVDLRYYINQYQVKLGSFVVPNSMPFFIRHMWMCSNLWIDSPTMKGQIYKFVPEGFWKYNETAEPSELEWTPLFVTTFDDIVAYGNALMAPISASEDLAIMSGDILKAYGDNIFKMDVLPEEYMVFPVYNLEVLSQIQNATVVVGVYRGNISEVVPDPGLGDPYLKYTPMFIMAENVSSAEWYGRRVLNMYKDDVKPEDTMVATRLMAFGTIDEDQRSNLMMTTIGSEIICGLSVYMYRHDRDGAWALNKISSNGYIQNINGDLATMNTYLRWKQAIHAFDYHPVFLTFTFNGDNQWTAIEIDTDFANYTIVDAITIGRMHDSALLSMLNVPVMGMFAQKWK